MGLVVQAWGELWSAGDGSDRGRLMAPAVLTCSGVGQSWVLRWREGAVTLPAR
jgi:hypothetical protein